MNVAGAAKRRFYSLGIVFKGIVYLLVFGILVIFDSCEKPVLFLEILFLPPLGKPISNH